MSAQLPSFPRRRESTFKFLQLFFKHQFFIIFNGFPPARE
ncbi:pilS cassette [Neisseria sicca]|uniref:PilS cassette n=1 Tax=Neisseria sicca TaxID=490 RepID=A0A2I1X982_NEISI|nr:pilS cassette [Neisseria sicca]